MKTSNLLLAMMAAAGLTIAGGAQAATAPMTHPAATPPGTTMTKEQRDAAHKDAAAQYKADKEACKSMTGNAKDVCMDEAKGKEKIAKAEADAAVVAAMKEPEPTPEDVETFTYAPSDVDVVYPKDYTGLPGAR